MEDLARVDAHTVAQERLIGQLVSGLLNTIEGDSTDAIIALMEEILSRLGTRPVTSPFQHPLLQCVATAIEDFLTHRSGYHVQVDGDSERRYLYCQLLERLWWSFHSEIITRYNQARVEVAPV